MTLLHVSPKTRINEKWYVHTMEIKKLMTQFPETTQLKNFIDTYGENDFSHDLNQIPFLHIVTETVFHYPSTFVSEKTIKPIANKRPFIIVGPKGSLKNLHELGFKTFNDYWDESYDLIDNPEQRLLAILDTTKEICKHSINDLRDLCKRMEYVLNYNFEYYLNNFKINELAKLEQACIKNLKSR